MILLLAIFTTLQMAHSAPQVIVGVDETEKLKDLDQKSEFFQRSFPTGRLKLPGKLGIPDYCTISLISENEVLTASHCLEKRDFTKMVAYFEYYTKDTKTLNPYQVKAIKVNYPTEDVAILELSGTPGKIYGYYAFANSVPAIGEPLIIFEHPGLDEKSVSRKNCFLKDTDNREFLHSCDTQGYSSGSPVLNTQFQIIGVHQGSQISDSSELNYGRLVKGLISN